MIRVGLSFILIGFILIVASCDEPERTIMTSAEREMVDSLYAKRVPYARKEADSICNATYQMMFDHAADSIKQVYIDEIKEIVEGEG
ncbi:MAG: hypothetical protein P1U56_12595 [Saprospiraceae bacterium]|nr:hypothetical protein [Saprospiraceae bacterium]